MAGPTEQLPCIEVEPSFQNIAKTADPAKLSEQLRHANDQLDNGGHLIRSAMFTRSFHLCVENRITFGITFHDR
jgi:hypothetical protein